MFTFEDFVKALHELRQRWGTKAFWQLPQANRDGALRGVTWLYFTAEMTDAERERAAVYYDSHMQEYARREFLNRAN